MDKIAARPKRLARSQKEMGRLQSYNNSSLSESISASHLGSVPVATSYAKGVGAVTGAAVGGTAGSHIYRNRRVYANKAVKASRNVAAKQPGSALHKTLDKSQKTVTKVLGIRTKAVNLAARKVGKAVSKAGYGRAGAAVRKGIPEALKMYRGHKGAVLGITAGTAIGSTAFRAAASLKKRRDFQARFGGAKGATRRAIATGVTGLVVKDHGVDAANATRSARLARDKNIANFKSYIDKRRVRRANG